MSSERAMMSLISKVALSLDGAVFGVALAWGAVCSLLKFSSTSAALRRLREAPSVGVADLRHLLLLTDQSTDGKLVIVRGTVEAKSTPDGSGESLRPFVLVSQESGERAVIVHRKSTCIYNEWKGLLGWASDVRTLFTSRKQEESSSLSKVPFVLVDGNERVFVDMVGSKHPLPLITVYHNLQPVSASPYTFLQTVFGHEYPVGLLDEEKILPIGKDISAVGICCLRNEIPEIKSCKDLPYFLSEMTKDEMIVDLDFRTRVLLGFGITLGLLSVGVLGYAVVRNWNKWKEWRQKRREQREQMNQAAATDANSDDEAEDVPDGQLCVVCLTRRKRSAFIPCGHMVCCRHCALTVERENSPVCPVCRQPIRTSIRIYGS